MSKKNKNTQDGLVYSTDPNFSVEEEHIEVVSLPIGQQKLQIFLDNKLKGNKQATVVAGFVGTTEDLEKLAKQLKNKCAAGGSVKNGEILIQGDFKQKIADFLQSQGYKVKVK